MFWEIQDRLPRSLTTITWEDSDSFVSVYSKDNPNLLFSMSGFEVRILPKIRERQEEFSLKEGVWSLVQTETKERTALAFLRVSDQAMKNFENRIRNILMSSGSTTFTKIASKYNSTLVAWSRTIEKRLPRPRNCLICLCAVRPRFKRVSRSVSTRRCHLDSRLQYSMRRRSLGDLACCLGTLISYSRKRQALVQANSRLVQSRIIRAGMTHDEETLIPNIFRYTTWESEFIDSQRVWTEYSQKRQEANQQNRRLTLEDLEEQWDRGIPRINTSSRKIAAHSALTRVSGRDGVQDLPHSMEQPVLVD